jgi:hypothetical protein
MKTYLFAAAAVWAMSTWPSFAFAQNADFRLITSPLPINLVAEPGTSVSSPIKIKNDGAVAETLKVELMKFGAYGENGAPQLLDPESGDEFLSWVRFSEKEFQVAPGEWKTIDATFDVPSTAAFGYYYAVVFSRSGETVQPKDGETALSGGTAVLVLLEARVPDAKREVAVVEFSADRKVYEFLPSTLTVRLKNTGNVHVVPSGSIFVGRGDGPEETLLDVNIRENGNILPGSFREFEVKWDDGFPVYRQKVEDERTVRDEAGNIVEELVWNWKDAAKFRFGKYQAKLLLVYDDGKRDVPIEGVVEFWVLPWRLMLAGFVVVVLVFIGIKSSVSNLWRNLFNREKKRSSE